MTEKEIMKEQKAFGRDLLIGGILMVLAGIIDRSWIITVLAFGVIGAGYLFYTEDHNIMYVDDED